MLRILIGRARSGKSSRILREIAEKGDAGRQILIVPEHASYQAEVDLCTACGATASRHAEVLSFRRLAVRVLSVCGGLSEVALDAGGKLLTLHKVLCELGPELKVYRSTPKRLAFLEQMVALFDEFISYALTPETLWAQAADLPGAMGEKLRDLAVIYAAYMARLHRPGQDARDLISRLCEHLEESSYLKDADLYIDGFSYFNAQEQTILATALRQVRSMTVTLLGEKNSHAEIFEASLRTRDQLIRLAGRAGCPCELVYTAAEDPSPLGHLERCFFGPTRPYTEPVGDAIHLLEADTPLTEVEQTAAEIVRLTAGGTFRYRDITVAARNMDVYESVIEQVFERYGIPAYISRRSDILETPLLALLTGALSAVTGGFEYEDVFRGLKTGLAGVTLQECDLLENYVKTWEIHGSLWTREEPWSANPDGYGVPWTEARTKTLETINALRERIRIPFMHLSRGLKSGRTAAGKVDALYSYLEELSLQSTLETRMERLEQEGRLQEADETAQLWTLLCAVLDQFVEILGDEPMENEEFVRLLRLVLTQYSIGTIPVALDQVHVSEITRNDRHAEKVVFLLGANDHVLPATVQSGGILNDDDREVLADRGITLAPAGMAQFHVELQNLYAALAQPTHRLTVSYPAADISGAVLRPAFVVDRIRTLFPDVRLEKESPDRTYRYAAVRPALEAAGERPGGAVWRYFASRPEYADSLRAMERAASMKRGRLSGEAVRALYGERFHMSASRLETLSSCHFDYFMRYGLRVKERPTAGFDAPEVGTFLHFLLEHVTREAMALGGFAQLTQAQLRALVRRFTDEYVSRELENFRDRDARFRYLFSRLRETAVSIVEQTADELAHSDFVPIAFELSFGDQGQLPAVEIREPGGELRVSGKVDRVDGWVRNGRLYLRVVDYKTGRKSFDLADVRVGLDIQMLLYLFTLQKEGERYFGMPVEPAGVLYLPARDEILSRERTVSDEQLLRERQKALRRTGLVLDQREVLEAMEHDALKEPHYLPIRLNKAGELTDGIASAAQLDRLSRYVDRLMHRIARELRDGDIDADPRCRSEEDTPCRYCAWASACQFEDGRGTDRMRYITPVKPAEFWAEIEEKGDGNDGEDSAH